MINKFIMNLIMPKQLGAVGTILAVGSGIAKGFGAKRRAKDTNKAQRKQQEVQKKIQAEQAVRERRRQVRESRIASSQVEAASLATGTGGSSGASNSQAAIQGDLATNLGEINTSLAESNLNFQAQQNTQNAGQPTFFETLNSALSPIINSNVSNLNDFFSPAKKP